MILVNGRGRMGDAVRELLDDDGIAYRTRVVIDFASPASCMRQISECVDRGRALVTGTTGLSDSQQEHVAWAAGIVPIVQSGSFSLGVNVLLGLVRQAAAAVTDWDIHIHETHHNRKVDAPSGTALMLRAALAEYDLDISTARVGEIIGEHTVTMAGPDEVLTFNHSARDRSLFARGAIVAANWVVDKPPGLYDMQDVLGLRTKET